MPDSASPSPTPARFYDATRLDPDESVGYLMRRVMSSIRTQVDSQLSLHGMTYTQWLPIYKLSLCPATTTVASLARDLETDPASMTRTLDRLEAKGLVARERSSTDRRVVQLALTPQGQDAAAKVPPVLADVLNGHLSGFTPDEWQQLLHLLRRMLANGETLRQRQPLDSPLSSSCAPNP